jgi:glycosyltransferase involved in cell wall biosynthesis
MNKTQRHKVGKEGRRRVLENYTQKKIAEDTVNVYRDIVK